MRSYPSCWSKTLLAKLGLRRKPQPKTRRPEAFRRRAQIECLEARQMLSITVDTLADVVSSTDGVRSLREAIAEATPADHTIVFHPSLDGGRIALTSQLSITQPIEIVGNGADKLTIDAQGLSRVFHVYAGVGSPSAPVKISGLTIAGGGGPIDHGGGIRNEGSLLLDSVVVSGNQAAYFGGGVYSTGPSLSLLNSTIDGNRSGWGGGIMANLDAGEAIWIENSTISNNLADDGSSGTSNGQAGGIWINSISGSPAGGAVENSTISGNRAEASGGGLFASGNSQVKLVNTTIAENVAGAYAGGILSQTTASPLLLWNTILASNTAANAALADGQGPLGGYSTFTSGYNFVGVNHISFGLSGNGNRLGVDANNPWDPKLSRLGDFGGPTKTHMPLPKSPVIDHGANGFTSGLAGDQRGSTPRAVEDPTTDNSPGNTVDIGAVEGDVRIAVGDFNGDGREDELRYSESLKSLIVFEGAANADGWEGGYWGSLTLAATQPSAWNGTIVGDFNGDGRDDVMVRAADYSWLLGISDGTRFHVRTLDVEGGAFTAGWHFAYVGDFDADGDEELLGQVDGQSTWLLVSYHEPVGTSKLATVAATGFAPGATVYIQDANRDGRDDLITRAGATSPWKVNLAGVSGDGSLLFQPATDWNSWINYGFTTETGVLDADKALAKVIEEFAWVYNNVELELYPGLMKGPDATQQTKAGNDWDQAALLEKRLQALSSGGVPLFGGSDVKIASARVTVNSAHWSRLSDWLGVKDPDAAFRVIENLLDANAVARDANGGDAIVTGLQPVAIEFTHAWVRVKVPTASGLDWIDLDPSWKFKDRQVGIPLAPTLNLAGGTHADIGLFDEFEYLALDPSTDHRLPVEFFEDQLMDWLSKHATYQGASLADVAHDGPIISRAFDHAPAGFGAGVTVVDRNNNGVYDGGDYDLYESFDWIAANTTLASQLTHRVMLGLERQTGADAWANEWSTSSSGKYEVVVPRDGQKAIQITFSPTQASVTDPNNIAPLGSTTYWSRLVVDGAHPGGQTSYASLSGLSSSNKIRVTVEHLGPTTLTPTSWNISKQYLREPGDVLALSLDANQHSRQSLVEQQSKLLTAVGGSTTEAALRPTIDDLAAYAGAKYWYDFNRYNKTVERLTQTVGGQQWVGSGIVTADPTFLTVDGSPAIAYLPFGIAPQNFGVDLPNAVQSFFNTALGDFNHEAWQLAIFNGSALEHNIVEETIGSESISTAKGLQRAYQRTMGLTSGGTVVSTDVVLVFVSTVDANNQRTVDHRYNLRKAASGDLVGAPLPKAALSEVQFKDKLLHHKTATGLDNKLWAFFQGLTPADGTVTVYVPEARTFMDEWNGAVYYAEIPGKSLQFAIVKDGGTITAGGYSGGKTKNTEVKPGNSPNASEAGDPVNTANGNMFRDETDFVFPNLGVPLKFSRHYDAQSKDDFGMGVGWMHSFGDLLYKDDKGTSSDLADDEIVWVAADGQKHIFKPNGSGSYLVPAELQGEFTIFPLATNGQEYFVFKTRYGIEYHFQKISLIQSGKSVVGRLSTIIDQNGDGIAVDYVDPASAPNNRKIFAVRDVHYANTYDPAVGNYTGNFPDRRLHFYYLNAADPKLITSITKVEETLNPPPGGPSDFPWWEFTYQTSSQQPNRLTSVRPRQNVSGTPIDLNLPVQYVYYASTHQSKFLIQRIVEADGAWHEYEYFHNGRVFRVKQGNLGQAPMDAGVEVQTFNYNLFRNLTEFIDERDNIETYIHQKNGLLEKQIHPDRTHQKYEWGDIGTPSEFLVESITDERGAVETFMYYSETDPLLLFKNKQLKESTAKQFPNQTAVLTRYDYVRPDAAGKPHLVAPYTVIVDPDSTVADPPSGYYAGQKLTTTHQYYASGDALGRLWKVTDAQGNTVEYAYYPNGDSLVYRRGLLMSQKNPAILNESGVPVVHETVFDYDVAGNVKSTTVRDAATPLVVLATTQFAYDSLGNVIRSIDPTSVVTESIYDVLGRLRETGFADANAAIDPFDAFTSRFTYDAVGRVRESKDALGRVTKFEYDGRGRLLKRINPDGTELLHVYDAAGNCIAITDELGRITRYVYDSRNRRIQTIHADGVVERTRYDGVGNVVASFDALGSVTTLKYDAAGRLLETKLPEPLSGATGPASPTTTNKYDKLGNLIVTIDPKLNVTRFEYDKLGRVVETRTLLAADVAAMGNVRSPAVTVTEPARAAAAATFDYDALGNVWRSATFDTSRPESLPADLKTLITTANVQDKRVHETRFTYDAFNRQLDKIDIIGTSKTRYDDAGRVKSQTDELNRVTDYVYEALTGRLAKTTLPDPDGSAGTEYVSPVTTYQYDAVGNRTAVTDPRGFTARYEYDAFNRLAAVTDALGGRSRTVYDKAGQMVAAIDALGRAAYTLYDERGRAKLQRSADPDGQGAALAPTTRLEYDDAGRLIKQTDPRGYATEYVYDSLGRLKVERRIHSEVVDDGDAGFAPTNIDDVPNRVVDLNSFVGDYTTITNAPGSHFAEATWTFTDLPAGTYRMAVTWRPDASLGTSVRAQVAMDGGSVQDPVGGYFAYDPSRAPNDAYREDDGVMRGWEEIPSVTITGAGAPSLRLVLSAAADTPLRADAVRLERFVETKYDYDANGNVTKATDELGRATDYVYDELDRVTTTTLPAPGVAGPEVAPAPLPAVAVANTYDGYGNLVKVVKELPYTPNDRITEYQYDHRNRRTQETLDAGADDPSLNLNYVNQRTEWKYDKVGNLKEIRELAEDPAAAGAFLLQRRTLYGYDQLDRMTWEIFNYDAASAADWRYTVNHYDAAGNVIKIEDNPGFDPRQIKTEYKYDALGRPIEMTASGLNNGITEKRTSRTVYDAVGNAVSQIDPLGRLGKSEYDRLDRLTKSIDPDPDNSGPGQPHVTTFQYDAAGNQTLQDNGAGQIDRYAYDAQGRQVLAVDGRGDETVRRYDAAGNLVRLTDPAGNVTSYAYDGLDRIKTETTSTGERKYIYDASGNLTIAVDRNERAIRRLYDRLDRITYERHYASEADARVGRTNSLATAFSDEIQYFYDELGRAEEEQLLKRKLVSSYSNDYRVTTSRQYDGLDRVTERTNQSIQLGSTNHTTGAPIAKQTYAYAFEGQSLVQTREQFVGGQLAARTRSHFNPFGELWLYEERDDGSTGQSAILDFEPYDAEFTYDASGALKTTLRKTDIDSSGWHNYVETVYAHDGAGRIKGITHQSRRYVGPGPWPAYQPLVAFGYTYDAADRINEIAIDWNTSLPAFTSRIDGGEIFLYDDAGQLEGVVGSLPPGSGDDAYYAYGPNGNRYQTEEPGGGFDEYTPGPQNRVDRDSSYRYVYDDEGNLVERWEQFTDESGQVVDGADRTFYKWDHQNRLVKVNEWHSDHEVLIVDYRYNASGELVYERVDKPFDSGAEVEHYVVESGERTMTLDSDGDVLRRYSHGPADQVLFDQVFDGYGNPALQTEGDLRLPLGDHQNSTRVVMGHDSFDAAYVRQSIDYDPFGRVRQVVVANPQSPMPAPQDALDTVFGWHGLTWDAAAELYWTQARPYSPDTAQFLSEDPIQYGSNWRIYSENDPINQNDRTGLSPKIHPLITGAGNLLGRAVAGLSNSLPTAGHVLGTGANAAYSSLVAAGPAANRGTVILPLAQPPGRVVRQITPGAPIVARDRADLPGVWAALDHPNQYIVANHGNQGYNILAPDGSVRFVTGDDYLPIGERARRSQIEGQTAAGRAAALDLLGEGLIAISPLHETTRDVRILVKGHDYYNPNTSQSFEDRHLATLGLFLPIGNSGQLRHVDEFFDALQTSRQATRFEPIRETGPSGATSLRSADPRLRIGYDPGAPQLDHPIAQVFGGTETRLTPAGLNLRKGGLEGELRKYENYLVSKGMRPEAARQVIASEIESLSRDVIAAPFTNVYPKGFLDQ